MDNKASIEIKKLLDPEEKLLWSGQPKQGFVLRRYDIFSLFIVLLWSVMVWQIMYWPSTEVVNYFDIVLIVLCIAFVLYCFIGRFFLDARQRKYTCYGLTEKRIIIISGKSKKQINSLTLNSLLGLTLMESSKNLGSIYFSNPSIFPIPPFMCGLTWPGFKDFFGPQFDLIENPKQRYQEVLEAQKQAI